MFCAYVCVHIHTEGMYVVNVNSVCNLLITETTEIYFAAPLHSLSHIHEKPEPKKN